MSEGRDLGAWLDRLGILAGDGAMGTALMAAGLAPGEAPELWNLDHAERVEGVHSAYVGAGAELIETNSFGGSPMKLRAFGLEGRCREINRTAAEIARSVAGDRALVVGSIGPSGSLLSPLGPMTSEEALAGFELQAAALAEGGADALCVETMIGLEEALIAATAASATGLPVMISLVFEPTPRGFFTMMGDSIADVARAALTSGPGPSRDAPGYGADPSRDGSRYGADPSRAALAGGVAALGVNCVPGSDAAAGIVAALRAETSLPILVQPNAGLPEAAPGGVRYPESPEAAARAVASLVEAGALIVGGCCGTTPDHVRLVSAEVRRLRANGPHRARGREEPHRRVPGY